MSGKRLLGTRAFCVIYNIIGILSLQNCYHGFQVLVQSHTLPWEEKALAQIVFITMTVLFFISTYLILKLKMWGYLIPIFLLSLIITGGFLLLLPLLAIHIYFFTHPKVHVHFT